MKNLHLVDKILAVISLTVFLYTLAVYAYYFGWL